MTILQKLVNLGIQPTTYIEVFRQNFKEIEYLKPRVYPNASRYKNLRRIQDDDTKKIYHEMINQKFVDFDDADTYITITADNENRLDKIANSYYGNAKYWWIIAQANYIIDPFNVPIGTTIRIPQIVSLYNQGGILSGR